jgi:hypothetical protein
MLYRRRLSVYPFHFVFATPPTPFWGFYELGIKKDHIVRMCML